MEARAPARGALLAAINVTPMADVMIVLLIIFMVATPLLREGRVKTPPLAENAGERDEAVVVELAADGALFLQGRPVARAADLALRLAEQPAGARELQLRAHESLPYAAVAKVLDACRAAGSERLLLVTRRRLFR
jgi:biopolymer transport protein ExbD